MRWQSYRVMNSLEETLERLADPSGRSRVIAGGTDLMAQARKEERLGAEVSLLDVSRIPELRTIVESGGRIRIGAAVTASQIVASALIRDKARALFQGAGWLGSPQIRNVATVGGNVVNAQPAADTAVPLVALGATATVVSPKGSREVPVEELFLGVGESAVDPSREIISSFAIPVSRGPRCGSAMHRLAKRNAFTLPQLSAAARVEVEMGGQTFGEVRIVAAPVSLVPWRATRAEEFLLGKEVTSDNVERAAALAREDARPRDSLRGSAAYRQAMVEVLVQRALQDALAQRSEVAHD